MHRIRPVVQRSAPPIRQSPSAAFTLVELLAVIAIISILMAFIMGAGRLAKQKSLISRAKADMEQIAMVLSAYHVDNGEYPLSLTDAEFNRKLPESVKRDVARNPIDPWSQPYQYASPGNSYTLFSRGPLPLDNRDDITQGK